MDGAKVAILFPVFVAGPHFTRHEPKCASTVGLDAGATGRSVGNQGLQLGALASQR